MNFIITVISSPTIKLLTDCCSSCQNSGCLACHHSSTWIHSICSSCSYFIKLLNFYQRLILKTTSFSLYIIPVSSYLQSQHIPWVSHPRWSRSATWSWVSRRGTWNYKSLPNRTTDNAVFCNNAARNSQANRRVFDQPYGNKGPARRKYCREN